MERDHVQSNSVTGFTISVTRLGNLLYFVQLFKACSNNYFAQIDHIFSQDVKIFHVYSGTIFGRLL